MWLYSTSYAHGQLVAVRCTLQHYPWPVTSSFVVSVPARGVGMKHPAVDGSTTFGQRMSVAALPMANDLVLVLFACG
jgi:hypothetical protein